MARHRDVRNLDADEYDDDVDSYGSSYGSSYVDETSLSTSMENYIYRRGGSTPKMGHFVLGRSDSVPSVPEEEDPGTDPDGRPRIRARSDSETSSGSNTYDDLTEDDQTRLAQCLDTILDIVGETIPEHLVKEAIVRCDFNSEVALNTLLNNPVGHRGGSKGTQSLSSSSSAAQIPKLSSEEPCCSTSNVFDSRPTTSKASTLVTDVRTKPVEVNAAARQNVETTASAAAAVAITVPVPAVPRLPLENQFLERPKDRDRSRSQSPCVGPSGAAGGASALPTTPSTTSTPRQVMRKSRIDAVTQYKKERGKDKDLLNMVVVGHVDSGKSTLMGHLLFKLGSVSAKAMHKFEQESRKLGKQSFAFAWVLDETSEERERGITMDVGQNRFETPAKSVTVLDAPGHKDFIPNMISGAYQADVAILVVNATRGEFEAGFDSGGQTREHALLVRSLGVSQLAVAVNKMDTVDWSEDRFREIEQKLQQFLKQVGFKDADVTYVPCSGFTGDNLVVRSAGVIGWYSGPTLLEAIDSFRPPERSVQKPFRMSIADVFKPSMQSTGFCISGRIESGFVQKEDKLVICPINQIASVKSVLLDEAPVTTAFAGDHVSLVLTGPDQASVANGMVVCDPAQPIPVTKHLRARIVVFNIDIPLTKGFPVVLHYGCVQAQAVIKKLVAQVNKSTGEVIKKRPRCLTKNCNAVVEIAVETPICMELYSNVKELGRFMLRSGGKTLAAGLVTDIY